MYNISIFPPKWIILNPSITCFLFKRITNDLLLTKINFMKFQSYSTKT